MIIANSLEDACMRRLWFILKQTYPDINFDMTIGHQTIIELDEKLYELITVNKIRDFSETYVVGWEDCFYER